MIITPYQYNLCDVLLILSIQINKWTDTSHLEAMFRRCNAHFEKLLQKYLMSSSSDVDTLVLHTRAHFDRNDWQNIPENLAAIFAVWSLTSSEVFQESKNMDVVLRPHPIQVILLLYLSLVVSN